MALRKYPTIENWSRQQTRALIQEYKNHPILYNRKQKESMDRKLRTEAFMQITKNIRRIKSDVCYAEVKNKLKQLSAQIEMEHKKKQNFVRKGFGKEEDYIPTFWCFQDLQFVLDNYVGNVETTTSRKSNDDIKRGIKDENDAHHEAKKMYIHLPTSSIDDCPAPTIKNFKSSRANEVSMPDIDESTESIEIINPFIEDTQEKSLDDQNPNEKEKIFVRTDLQAAPRTENGQSVPNESMNASECMDFVNTFKVVNKPAERSDEEIFCELLCRELQGIRMVSNYESVTTQILTLVRAVKAEERKLLNKTMDLRADRK